MTASPCVLIHTPCVIDDCYCSVCAAAGRDPHTRHWFDPTAKRPLTCLVCHPEMEKKPQ